LKGSRGDRGSYVDSRFSELRVQGSEFRVGGGILNLELQTFFSLKLSLQRYCDARKKD
jgi:hypothetical protein